MGLPARYGRELALARPRFFDDDDGGLLDPDYRNTLGIDVDSFSLRLAGRDTAMTLSLKSPDDLIRLGAIGLVVDL